MASKSSRPVRTVFQCSECDHCSQDIHEATLHAVQIHGEDRDDDDDDEYQEESEDEILPQIQIKEDKELILSDEEDSSISLYKQSNGNLERKGKRNESWSSDATKLLIECVQEHYANLNSRNVKKKSVWEEIRSSLENHVPEVTAMQCEQKWKSLLTAQKKFLSNCSKPYGKSKYKKPEFFDDIVEVIGENLSEISLQNDFDSLNPSNNLKSLGTKGKKNNANPYQLHQDEGNLESSMDQSSQSSFQGNEAIFTLTRLVSILERREAANERFQREVLEIEREKLRYIQRFIEGREKFNNKRCQLMKEWMSNSRTKRKREDD